MSDSWSNAYRQSYSVFEARGCSDHLRCRIQITADAMKPRRPFKFTNALISFTEFPRLMEDFWGNTENLFMSTSALFRFSKKLKALKIELRKLSKEKFADLSKRTKEAYREICECQERTMMNNTPDAISQEGRALARWQRLSELEEKFLQQKSKLHWLKVGDKNNRYFHQAAKVREVRNAIREVKRHDGMLVNSQEEIKQEAERFYKTFLGYKVENYVGMNVEKVKELMNYECSDFEADSLTRTVTEKEIMDVMFCYGK